MPVRSLVLSGGNALGCFHAGAYEALQTAGEEPSWIAGTSIGAITAALLAGNPPERRIERLAEFWRRASSPDWLPGIDTARWINPLQTRLLGRPELFHPHLSLSGRPERTAVYDAAPMRRCLETLIDFDRLNGGDIRVSMLATDLATGDEVVFETGEQRITVDHLMACAALIPDFPPVRIGERWLVDGGLAANTPVDLVLGRARTDDMVCYVVDLFPAAGPVPDDVAGMSMRQSDLTFACQTERTLRTLVALDRLGPADRPRVDVVRITYAAFADETAMKTWDFSASAIDRRWHAGQADMSGAIRHYRALRTDGVGLRVLNYRSHSDAFGPSLPVLERTSG